MKVGIVGCGMVGGTLETYFNRRTTHTLFKKDKDKGLNDNVHSCEAIFVCVPTPTRDNRSQDLSMLESVLVDLSEYCKPIFIKSTILPGTTSRLRIKYRNDLIHMPEFLSEKTAFNDFDNKPIVVGGKGFDNESDILHLCYVLFPWKVVYQVTNTEAELIKYTNNCFNSMKINYFNIIKNACDNLSLNYESIKSIIPSLGFIEKTLLDVPGHDGKNGFGGKCLPKDLSAFIGFLDNNQLQGGTTLESIEKDNKWFRK